MASAARKLSLILAALALAGCGINPQPAPRPAPPAPPPPPPSVVGAPITALDPATVPGARPMSIAVDGPGAVRAGWSYISGADSYNTALDNKLLGILDKNAGGRFEPAVPAPGKPALDNGLKLEQDIILANSTLLGTRFIRSQAVKGALTPVSITTSFNDLSTGKQLGGKDLVAPEKLEPLRALLLDAVEADPAFAPAATPSAGATTGTASAPPSSASAPGATSGATSGAPGGTTTSPTPGTAPASTHAPVKPPAADVLLSGAAFDADGKFVVPLLVDPATGSPLPEKAIVHITKGAATPLLSEQGLRVQGLALAPAPLTPPPAAAPALEHINCDIAPCAALTYDDGPNEQTTRLLKILADRSVYATFFEQGIYAASNPAIAAATAKAGHVIANHTVNHPHLGKMSVPAAVAEVQGATEMIKQASGETTRYLRPPYGDMTARVAGAMGMPLVNWSVDSLDWLTRDKNKFIPTVMELVQPGSVILQHDIHKTTVDGQEQLIDGLLAAGYHLVTIPQLFQGIEMHNGQSYFCRGDAYPCTPGR